jgi:hypothetical protein
MDQVNSVKRKVSLVAMHSVETTGHSAKETVMQLALQFLMAKAEGHWTAEGALVAETRSPAMMHLVSGR